MDTIIYVVIGLVVALALWLLLRKKAEPSTGAPGDTRELDADIDPAGAKHTSESSAARTEGAARGASEASAVHSHPAGAKLTPEASPSEQASVVSPTGAGHRPSSTSVLPPDHGMRRMRTGLARSREEAGFFGKLKALLVGSSELPPTLAEDIEEVLLASDVGVPTTRAIIERVQSDLTRSEAKDATAVWAALRQEAKRILSVGGTSGALRLSHRPTVILFVGVNGAGKTTTIGKLATKLKAEGKTCVLAAGDTFRAAAVQQLSIWGQRVGCEVVRGKDGADPGSVVFDAIKRAEELGADVVLADSAGRLHTKSNLMAEMQKIARTASKALPGAPHEVLLVIDSTNGQNALAQAREFKESLELGGIVLTKLDGTAKGGVILGIADTLKVPVRYVGLGERSDDLHEFVADDFVEALLGKDA